jgi:predicted nuclease of predicted toxin-antitoxin system
MKLLFDQNLSSKLPPILNPVFPGSKHVKDFGLTGNDDEAIWQLASEQSFVIVSKDSDFLHRSLLRGHPPKVIQVRVGNCSTHHIHKLFIREEGAINEFLNNPNEALLIIG